MFKLKERFLLITIAAVLLVAIAGCGGGSGTQNGGGANNQNKGKFDLGMKSGDVVVAYKGGSVTAGEFEQFLSILGVLNPQDTTLQDPANWEPVLDEYVLQKILAQRATEKGLKADQTEVDQVYGQTKAGVEQTLKGETFPQYLAKQGLDEAKVKSAISTFSLINKYLTTTKSDEELKKIYEQDKEGYTIASVRHILITTEKHKDDEAKKLANDLANRIRKGEDFAKLADQYTEDPGNTNQDGTKNGGLYKDTPVANWVEPFKKAALTLPLNQVSDPVKTDYGYHVMRVEKREVEAFDKVKQYIIQQQAYVFYDDFKTKELPTLIEKKNLPSKMKEAAPKK